MIHLVTYASPDMSISAQLCRESALRNGIQKVWQWTRPAIEQTEFYKLNKDILDQPRGNGYWLWKPFIILETLNKMAPGDIVVYADAGVEFVSPINHVINKMDDIWLFGNMYQHVHWCKADVMKAINCFDSGSQVQASVIIVRKTVNSISFIAEWLTWCTVLGMIDDSPSKTQNHPEFQEHRHDQAILTTLAKRERMPLHWWPAMYNNGAFIYEKGNYKDQYPVLFHHHRKRNHEWEKK